MTRTRPFMVSVHDTQLCNMFLSASTKGSMEINFYSFSHAKHALKHAIDVCVSLKRVMITASTSTNASFYINYICKTQNSNTAALPLLHSICTTPQHARTHTRIHTFELLLLVSAAMPHLFTPVQLFPSDIALQ